MGKFLSQYEILLKKARTDFSAAETLYADNHTSTLPLTSFTVVAPSDSGSPVSDLCQLPQK